MDINSRYFIKLDDEEFYTRNGKPNLYEIEKVINIFDLNIK